MDSFLVKLLTYSLTPGMKEAVTFSAGKAPFMNHVPIFAHIILQNVYSAVVCKILKCPVLSVAPAGGLLRQLYPDKSVWFESLVW